MAQELRTELRDNDVLQLLAELGGSATLAQIRELALERFTPEVVRKHLHQRLDYLCRWKQVERGGYLKHGKLTYSLVSQSAKSAKEVQREAQTAMNNIVIIKHDRLNLTECGRRCPVCCERLTVFDKIVRRRYMANTKQKFVGYFHEKCAEKLQTVSNQQFG